MQQLIFHSQIRASTTDSKVQNQNRTCSACSEERRVYQSVNAKAAQLEGLVP